MFSWSVVQLLLLALVCGVGPSSLVENLFGGSRGAPAQPPGLRIPFIGGGPPTNIGCECIIGDNGMRLCMDQLVEG